MSRADEREARLAAQLRENLRRRKAQARAAVAGPADGTTSADDDAPPPQRDAE